MRKTLHRTRRLFLFVVLGAIVLSSQGCLNRYKVTLTSGNIITTRSRPKHDKATDTFRFKDVEGEPRTIPSIRVKEIEPL